MVSAMNCGACRDCIQEASQSAGNALQLAEALSASVQAHLQSCAACREACSASLRLEGALRELKFELPAPDLRGSVMARIRAGERAAVPRISSPQPFAAREVVGVMIVFTLGTAWAAPAWLPWFAAISDWLAAFSGFGLDLPEIPLDPVRDTALLCCLLLVCAWQTRSWLQVRHG